MQRNSAVTDRPRLVGLQDLPASPDIKISVRQSFGIDSDLQVPAFSQTTEYVPEVDEAYRFDPAPLWRYSPASPTTVA